MNDKLQALIGALTECINCLTPGRDDAKMKRAHKALKQAATIPPATPRERTLAREQYAEHSGDDVFIDDDAVVSRIDQSKNIWVSAWVYVRKDV